MSIGLLGLVFGIPLPPGQKLVMLALAHHADEEGLCWPSQAALGVASSLDVRQVRRNVAALSVRGYLTREPGRGRGVSTRYHLDAERLKADMMSALALRKADIAESDACTDAPEKADIGEAKTCRKADTTTLFSAPQKADICDKKRTSHDPLKINRKIKISLSKGEGWPVRLTEDGSLAIIDGAWFDRMLRKYPELGEERIRDELVAGVNHTNGRKWQRKDLYLDGWLRRRRRWDSERSSRNGKAPRQPARPGDFWGQPDGVAPREG